MDMPDVPIYSIQNLPNLFFKNANKKNPAMFPDLSIMAILPGGRKSGIGLIKPNGGISLSIDLWDCLSPCPMLSAHM